MILLYSKILKKFSQKLRKEMTEAEKKLWSKLRRKQIDNVQFYRQRPIGKYIVDFFAPQAKLVIELDGSQHYKDQSRRKDIVRDKYLCSLGLRVLRFNDLEVFRNLDDILEEIYRKILPSPPLEKEGNSP